MSASVAALRTTPLHDWIAGKLGVRPEALSRDRLAAYQLALLNETLSWARERSAFYRERLAQVSGAPLVSLEGVRVLPFTTPADLARDAGRFVCVSQDEIRRIVTLQTSGTGGAPKRVFFTESDLELALDFFQHGVSAVATPGDRMVIALPGEREDSVGRQLAQGIARAGVIPVPCGVLANPASALALLESHRAAALIGLPVHILALACHAEAAGSTAFHDLRSIVLCSDHVPSSLVRALRRRTRAAIFEHYGMTEMGLGGGIDCEAHAGYHLRECDFLFEIVDPASGEPRPEGMAGEIVFTTLTRRGMPLIRYRTGDLSGFLPGPCECGTILRRLARVRDRIDSPVSLGSCGTLTQSALDEALFAIEGIVDFSAILTPGSPAHLEILACCSRIPGGANEASLLGALDGIPSVLAAKQSGALRTEIRLTLDPLPATRAKRRIQIGGGA
jgi:phenylacetate-CoA ligase